MPLCVPESWCAVFVFFFQAEDGIRDVAVTGVQTCALPIWLLERAGHPKPEEPVLHGREGRAPRASGGPRARATLPDGGGIYRRERPRDHRTDAEQRRRHRPLQERSEERRVGKECRSRWSPYH